MSFLISVLTSIGVALAKWLIGMFVDYSEKAAAAHKRLEEIQKARDELKNAKTKEEMDKAADDIFKNS